MSHQKTDLVEHALCGWQEIREALIQVEELRSKGVNAKIELVDESLESSEKVLLYSFGDLQKLIVRKFSKMLVDGVTTPIPLDDFERLVSETSVNLFGESNHITGRLLLGS